MLKTCNDKEMKMENGWHYTRADAIRALREIHETLKDWQDQAPQIEQGMEDDDVSYIFTELKLCMFEVVQYIDKKNEILKCAATQAMRYGIEDGVQLGLLQEIKAELERAEAKLKEAGMPKAITLGSTADIVREAHQHCTDALQYNLCKPTEQAARRVPDELTTPEAKKWMEYAVSKGLLDKDWMPTDKVATKPQKALLVELLCERIGLRSNRGGTLYKPFEVLWNVSGLAQERYKSKEEKGTVRGGEMIEEAFKE